MSSTPRLELHVDRLLPSEPALRSIARRLYESVAEHWSSYRGTPVRPKAFKL